MAEDPTRHDLFASLGNLGPDELIEFIEQLQNAVDAAEARADSQASRVRKLEVDRDVLRTRLEAARTQLTRLRANPFGKLASRLTAQPKSPDTVTTAADTQAPRTSDSLRVATILDEISDACWSPEFDNIRLSRGTWRKQLEESSPDLVFVESAFGGVDGSWARRVAHFGNPHPDVAELVQACKDLGVPTVFWNKEDPINYPWFIGAASVFDHVFTVDADQIPSYQKDLGHSRVHVLPFAAQPTLHHPPAPGSERPGTVGFAGSYYARKHAERRVQMDMLLTPALAFGLDIYDRMDRADDPRFAWPEQFRSHIAGSIPYPEMGDVYRRYKVFLNVNTVTDSPTMCARRVFELAATGTPIVSGPSQAIGEMVPPGVVAVVDSPDQASTAIHRLLEDHDDRDETSTVGPRWISESHTYHHRLSTVREVL